MDKERAKAREGEKGITIGIVGPSSSCGMVEKSLYEIDETLSVKCYTREQVNACGQVMNQCEQECDVIHGKSKSHILLWGVLPFPWPMLFLKWNDKILSWTLSVLML